MNGLLQDLRYAVRQLRKSPGFTAVAVLTLALGIGAITAMFSLVDRILFRSLSYPNDDELVSVGVIAPIIDGEFLFSANYLGWRDHQTPFIGFTSSTGASDCDLTDDHPVRVSCASVASTFLPTFGIQPVLGRNFTREEDRPNAPRVALLAYGLWQRRFGLPGLSSVALSDSLPPGTKDPLGKIVRFLQGEGRADAAFTVIGVAGNTQNQGLGGRVGPEYYMVRQHTENDVIFPYPDSQRFSIVVRSAVGPQTMAQELRNTVARLDPSLPVEGNTLSQSVARLAERPRFSGLAFAVCRGWPALDGDRHLRRRFTAGESTHSRDRRPHGSGSNSHQCRQNDNVASVRMGWLRRRRGDFRLARCCPLDRFVVVRDTRERPSDVG